MKMNSLPLEPSFELQELRAFVREKILPGGGERDAQGIFPVELFRELGKLGWLAPFIPSEHGGSSASTTDLIWIARELAYASPGMATSYAGNILAAMPVVLHGRASLKGTFCRSVLEHHSLSSFCFTEPDAGSDILSISTKAVRVPGGYRINGKKCFITNANYAEHLVVILKVAGSAPPKKAITAFYVPANSPGVSFGKPYKKMGHRDSNTAEVFFEDVFVPEEFRLGEEGQGLSIAFQALQRSRTLFSAAAVGLCFRAGDLVGENLGSRMRFGKPLLSQPTIQNFLAQHYTDLQAAWLLTCSAAAEWDSGNFTEMRHSSMAKLYSGQVAVRFLSGAVELFGGYGYMREYEIERLYRDAKLYEIIEGPTFVQQLIIAKELFPQMQKHRVAEVSKREAA